MQQQKSLRSESDKISDHYNIYIPGIWVVIVVSISVTSTAFATGQQPLMPCG